jgi:hypothetical protein
MRRPSNYVTDAQINGIVHRIRFEQSLLDKFTAVQKKALYSSLLDYVLLAGYSSYYRKLLSNQIPFLEQAEREAAKAAAKQAEREAAKAAAKQAEREAAEAAAKAALQDKLIASRTKYRLAVKDARDGKASAQAVRAAKAEWKGAARAAMAAEREAAQAVRAAKAASAAKSAAPPKIEVHGPLRTNYADYNTPIVPPETRRICKLY